MYYLKDDKTYPYIRIGMKRRISKYIHNKKNSKTMELNIFGPYANPGAAREMLNFIKEKFQIRQCKTF